MSFRSRLANGVWSYALQGVNVASAAIMLPILTRSLGAEGYGEFSSALNLITYLSILTAFGFDYWGARAVSGQTSMAAVRSVFYLVLLGRSLILVVALCGWLIIIYLRALDGQALSPTVILVFWLIGTTYNQNWLFIGLERLKAITVATCVGKVGVVLGVIIFVADRSDLLVYCWLFALGQVLVTGVQMFLAFRLIRGPVPRVRFGEVARSLISSRHLFITNILNTLMAGVGVTILTIKGDMHEVGEYSAVLRVVQFVILAVSPIFLVFYPVSCSKFAESWDEGVRFVRKLGWAVLISVFVVCVSIGLTRDIVVDVVLGPEFVPASGLVLPLLGWAFCGVAVNLLGTQILTASGRESTYSRVVVLAAVVTVVLSAILGAGQGAVGVAIGVLVGEAVGLCALFGVVVYVNRTMRSRSRAAATLD